VLTVGAAQILLKNSGQIPEGNVWIAGSGPLPLLYATQLMRAGGKLAGFLDTTPAGQWKAAVRHFPRALLGGGDLLKGLGWLRSLKASGIMMLKAVSEVEALGADRLQEVRFRTLEGQTVAAGADVLLVHEGVVPQIHPALSLDCQVHWDDAQHCFSPTLDLWGESSIRGLFIAGDGARSALHRGILSALGAAVRLGHLNERAARKLSKRAQRSLSHELAVRPFLDAMFRPRSEILVPRDETIVCRCEEVTAGTIRKCAAVGRPGPSQIKTATRVGMGPCQGRQCGYTVTSLLASAQGRSPAEVGFFHVRPPISPVTLEELASLDSEVRTHAENSTADAE
jgi:hypothetical protein